MVAPIKYPLEIEGVDPRDITRPNGPKSKWAHITCHWKEISKKEGGVVQYIDRKYPATINCESEKIYVSDKKLELVIKFCALIPGTSYYLLAKTIYHLLFPLSLAHQIYQTVKEVKAEKAEAIKNGREAPNDLRSRIGKVILNNFIDIVRTPLYAVALTVVAIASLILAPIRPEILYEGRVIYGELLISLNRGNKNSLWTIAPCMQPLAALKKNEEKKFYVKADTFYDGEPGTKAHALNNLARRHLNLENKERPPAWEKLCPKPKP